MTYAARTDMVRLYSEPVLVALTDLLGAGVVDEASLSAALAAADAEVNSYISGRVVLPLASVVPGLADKAASIARYFLDGQNGDENVRLRYKDVIAWLRDVQAGRASLGLDVNQAPTPVSNGAFIQSGGRVFERGSR